MTTAAHCDDLLGQLAGTMPTPAGGSAAAFTGAAAAALLGKIAKLTMEKKKYEHLRSEMQKIDQQAEVWCTCLSGLVQQDADAYTAIIRARRLPRASAQQESARRQAIEAATLHAARVPLHVATVSVNVMETAVILAETANINTISDAGASGALARAAITASVYNVKINLLGHEEHPLAQQYLADVRGLLEKCDSLHQQMQKVLRERGGVI